MRWNVVRLDLRDELMVDTLRRAHPHVDSDVQVRASVKLHMNLVDRVLRLPVAFFDRNPSGRVINRFSRDTDIMDTVLPLSLSQV